MVDQDLNTLLLSMRQQGFSFLMSIQDWPKPLGSSMFEFTNPNFKHTTIMLSIVPENIVGIVNDLAAKAMLEHYGSS